MAGKKKETAGKSQATSRKVADKSQEQIQELCWVWKDGDSLQKVAQALTGHVYMDFALLNYNEMQAVDIKPGTILKWRVN